MLRMVKAEGTGIGTARVSLAVSVVALGSIAFEVALTRYFTVASWAEYGYWVISIAMVGLALSGVVLALFRNFFIDHFRPFFMLLPLALVVLMTAGFHAATLIPFNPIELQNPFLWKRQLGYVALYYGALSPSFFCGGLFLGLCFMALQRHVTSLYAADLIGAGIGSILMLPAMSLVHPFYLVAVVVGALSLAPLANVPMARRGRRLALAGCTVAVVACCEASLVWWNHARMFEYKEAYALLMTPDNKVRQTVTSARGYDQVLDNFVERRDLPLTNNLSLLNVEPPPRAYGLYRDGSRVTSLVATEFKSDFGYVKGALSTLPYLMRPVKEVLLVGTDGGFRLAEVRALGVKGIVGLETDKTVRARLTEEAEEGQLVADSPQSYLARTPRQFDVIDTGDDFLQGPNGGTFGLTVEGLQLQLDHLNEGGLLSVPVEISEFPEYAVRVVLSAVEALRGRGIEKPFDHLLVFRSEWMARILVSKRPLTGGDVEAAKGFCQERSFDLSYFPGMTRENAGGMEIWNELPHFVLETETDFGEGGPVDAIRDHVLALVEGEGAASPCEASFGLAAVTNSRPFLNYIIRPASIVRALKRMDYLPQAEMGLLINYAVFIQALVIAALVGLIPFARFSKGPLPVATVGRTSVYFASIGLGYLMVEIMLIERFAAVFQDAVTTFSVVLCSLLIWSGIGSWLVGRAESPKRRVVLLTAATLVLAGVFLTVLWDETLVVLGTLPVAARCAILALSLCPLGLGMGMPFSAATANLSGPTERLVPIAWGVNGAFSVVAPPLARLLAVYAGFNFVLWVALGLYLLAWWCFPRGDSKLKAEGAF